MTLGRIAFEAYREAVGGKTFDGKPIPGWADLHGDADKIRAGWEAAAGRTADAVRDALGVNAKFDMVFQLLDGNGAVVHTWTGPGHADGCTWDYSPGVDRVRDAGLFARYRVTTRKHEECPPA